MKVKASAVHLCSRSNCDNVCFSDLRYGSNYEWLGWRGCLMNTYLDSDAWLKWRAVKLVEQSAYHHATITRLSLLD